MYGLGESILVALTTRTWDTSVNVQLHERDVCYQQICELLLPHSLWAHLSDMPDRKIREVSKLAHEKLDDLIKQNAKLEREIQKSMVTAQKHLVEVQQRKKLEQTYHPVTDMSGGFIAEDR